jgi:hypothetical protein
MACAYNLLKVCKIMDNRCDLRMLKKVLPAIFFCDEQKNFSKRLLTFTSYKIPLSRKIFDKVEYFSHI